MWQWTHRRTIPDLIHERFIIKSGENFFSFDEPQRI